MAKDVKEISETERLGRRNSAVATGRLIRAHLGVLASQIDGLKDSRTYLSQDADLRAVDVTLNAWKTAGLDAAVKAFLDSEAGR